MKTMKTTHLVAAAGLVAAAAAEALRRRAEERHRKQLVEVFQVGVEAGMDAERERATR